MSVLACSENVYRETDGVQVSGVSVQWVQQAQSLLRQVEHPGALFTDAEGDGCAHGALQGQILRTGGLVRLCQPRIRPDILPIFKISISNTEIRI